jgi:WD40 repeat protein
MAFPTHCEAMMKELPTELWIVICEYLCLNDTMRLRLICPYMLEVTKSASIWRNLALKDKADHIESPYESLKEFILARKKWLSLKESVELDSHSHAVSALASSGPFVYTGSWDGVVKCYDSSRRQILNLDLGSGAISSIAINKKHLLIGHKKAPFLTMVSLDTKKNVSLRPSMMSNRVAGDSTFDKQCATVRYPGQDIVFLDLVEGKRT